MTRTVKDLAALLASALGVSPRMIESSAELLAARGLCAGLDDAATATDAAALLISAAVPGVSHPAKVLDQYGYLPSLGVESAGLMADGVFVTKRADGPCEMMPGLFWNELARVIEEYCGWSETVIEPSFIQVGFTRGISSAGIAFSPVGGGPHGEDMLMALFGTGETRLPDDSSPAQIQTVTMIPGGVFPVLRSFFGRNDPVRLVPADPAIFDGQAEPEGTSGEAAEN